MVLRFESGDVYPVYSSLRSDPLGTRAFYDSLEDLEGYGRTFYRMAAQHPKAQQHALTDVLSTLAEEFVLAEKPLACIAQRYLAHHRQNLFPIQFHPVRL